MYDLYMVLSDLGQVCAGYRRESVTVVLDSARWKVQWAAHEEWPNCRCVHWRSKIHVQHWSSCRQTCRQTWDTARWELAGGWQKRQRYSPESGRWGYKLRPRIALVPQGHWGCLPGRWALGSSQQFNWVDMVVCMRVSMLESLDQTVVITVCCL